MRSVWPVWPLHQYWTCHWLDFRCTHRIIQKASIFCYAKKKRCPTIFFSFFHQYLVISHVWCPNTKRWHWLHFHVHGINTNLHDNDHLSKRLLRLWHSKPSVGSGGLLGRLWPVFLQCTFWCLRQLVRELSDRSQTTGWWCGLLVCLSILLILQILGTYWFADFGSAEYTSCCVHLAVGSCLCGALQCNL